MRADGITPHHCLKELFASVFLKTTIYLRFSLKLIWTPKGSLEKYVQVATVGKVNTFLDLSLSVSE